MGGAHGKLVAGEARVADAHRAYLTGSSDGRCLHGDPHTPISVTGLNPTALCAACAWSSASG